MVAACARLFYPAPGGGSARINPQRIVGARGESKLGLGPCGVWGDPPTRDWTPRSRSAMERRSWHTNRRRRWHVDSAQPARANSVGRFWSSLRLVERSPCSPS